MSYLATLIHVLYTVSHNWAPRSLPLCQRTEYYIIGMSFGVRFKVLTFGNKHPDGSNVHIFSAGHNITCTFTCVLMECSLERTLIINGVVSVDVMQKHNAIQFRKIHLHSQK